jgi:hypothetical protein
MKTRKFISKFLIFIFALAVHKYAEAQYKVPHKVIGTGGIAVNNGSYRLNGTVGQPGMGVIHNPSYINKIGFWYQTGGFTSGVEPTSDGLPTEYRLHQNYPNPFNPSTTIEFALPKPAFVTLKVYNLLGEEVAILIAEKRTAGIQKLNWDANGLASGVYLYRLEAGGFVETKKLILMR